MSEELQNFQRGLDALLHQAHTRVGGQVGDKVAAIRTSRAQLDDYRAEMKALRDDVTHTRACEAHLGRFLLGYSPGDGALPPPRVPPNVIPAPEGKATREDIARVASELAPPRFLQRAR